MTVKTTVLKSSTPNSYAELHFTMIVKLIVKVDIETRLQDVYTVLLYARYIFSQFVSGR